MCIDRMAGKQLSPRGNSQPRFTSGHARISNYRSQLCQKPLLFLSIDRMTGLHPLTHKRTCIHALLSRSLFSWCTCLPGSPGQLNSYERSWALFFQKANPTPVFRLYTVRRVSVNARVQCVYRPVKERVFVFERKRGRERDSLCFWEIKNKNGVYVALLWKDLRTDIWRLQGRLYSFQWWWRIKGHSGNSLGLILHGVGSAMK